MSVSDDVTLVVEETLTDLEAGRSGNRWLVWGIVAFLAAFVIGFLSVRAASKKTADSESASPAETS
jgi:hypothetical protein